VTLTTSKVPVGTDERPNVLVIMTDQHRYDLMTCAGREIVPTPNIDRIAARGVRFSHAYCPYPVCLASRSALLTGLYAHNTGAINNQDRLDWRFRTMANHFGDHGYLTGLIGKMHFNDAHKHGFEYYLSVNDWLMYLGPKVRHYANEIANHPIAPVFFDTLVDDGAGFPDVSDLWDGPSPWVGQVDRLDFKSMASDLDPEDHLDMFIARESTKFLGRYRDQRFFLVASFMKPHSPFYPPREYAERYPIEEMSLPPVGDLSGYPEHIRARIANMQALGEWRLRAHRAGYMGNLAFADECVGHLLDGLERLGLSGNTIIVYASDHGEMDGDHGLYQKFCLFEPSVRVPLAVAYPRVLPRGVVCDALTEYIGLYPTLAELTGTTMADSVARVPWPDAPGKIDAHSFAPLLQDPSLPGPGAVFSEFNLRSAPCQYMVRTQRHKYIHNEGSLDELYDQESDPGEFVNLINEPSLADVRRSLREQLFDWYDPSTNPYRTGQAERDAQVLRERES